MGHEALLQFIDALPHSPEHACSYLAAELARTQQFYWPREQGPMPGAFYQLLMDHHFRRSGRVFYRPRCAGCRACVPLRVPVRGFTPRRTHARVQKKNRDVTVSWGPPAFTAEKFALYAGYVAARHRGGDAAGPREPPTPADFCEFLYDSPIETIEGTYLIDGRLVGVGICDLTPQALSSVYFYFSPDAAARSLGTFSMLEEVAQAARLGRDYYYLGYWVEGSRKMAYKAEFADHYELLGEDGWQRSSRLAK